MLPERKKRMIHNVCMGFIMSKLYKGHTFSMLVLKPKNAKRYTVVDEFFNYALTEHKILFRYIGEFLTYHKVLWGGRGISVLEMHDEEKGDVFWDCVQDMDGVAYFIESITVSNTEKVLQIVQSIRETHTEAALLLVVVSVNVSEDAYVQFKKQVKSILRNRRYKIVDGGQVYEEPTLNSYAPTKETICQGLSWVIQQEK